MRRLAVIAARKSVACAERAHKPSPERPALSDGPCHVRPRSAAALPADEEHRMGRTTPGAAPLAGIFFAADYAAPRWRAEGSLERLCAATALDGFVPAAATGEGLALDDAETERLVAIAARARSRPADLFPPLRQGRARCSGGSLPPPTGRSTDFSSPLPPIRGLRRKACAGISARLPRRRQSRSSSTTSPTAPASTLPTRR